MRRNGFRLAPALVLAMLAAACGGGGDDAAPKLDDLAVDAGDVLDDLDASSPAPGGPDVCELIAEADVEAALGGGDVGPGQSGPGMCTYSTEGLPLIVVTLQVQQGALTTAPFDEMISAMGDSDGFGLGGDGVEVTGLGDRAVAVDSTVPMLFVAHGDDLVVVSVMADDGGDDAQVELAELLLSRM